MSQQKSEIITFKADAQLVDALSSIPNRSEFIRHALLSALDNICPVCQGTGALSPRQKRHFGEFLQNHAVQECDECHEIHLVCTHGE